MANIATTSVSIGRSSFEDLMDVTFTFEDSEGTQRIRAHKLILAACSPVFRMMFFGGFKEEAVIKIVDIQEAVFQKLIDFVYSKPLELKSIDEAIKVFTAGDKYDISTVTSKVEDYLCSLLSVENCIEIYDLISPFQAPTIKQKCVEMFTNNTKAILASSGFYEASADTVNTICCLEKIKGTSELDVYMALERWVSARGGNASSFKNQIKKSFQCIRFLTMSVDDVCTMKLLTPKERTCIIANIYVNRPFRSWPKPMLVSRGPLPMPDGFSTLTNRRRFEDDPPHCDRCDNRSFDPYASSYEGSDY